MKKTKFVLTWLLIISVAATVCVVLTACTTKKAEYLTTDKINNFTEVQNDNAMYLEWNYGYKNSRPTMILFHGETDKEFVFNLDKRVYNESVTDTSETINHKTLGWKAQGIREAKDGDYYDVAFYWERTANINVGILHYEKFVYDENTESILTKILTSYKSRYVLDGEVKEVNLGYSLAEVASAYINEELQKLGQKGEVRYVGNGVGATFALSCAYYANLYTDTNSTVSALMPSRVTLCDPYYDVDALSFKASFDESLDGSEGSIGLIEKEVKSLSSTPTAVEIIESLEHSKNKENEEINYAYETDRNLAKESIKNIKENSAYLTLEERYSSNESFRDYKQYKRIALDWYLYSVIGSDDSFERASGVGEFPAGYPHDIEDFENVSDLSRTNWGENATRPILNNRAISNDYTESAGAKRGFNYGISAWTPTIYVKTLQGVEFVQKRATDNAPDSDAHGTSNFFYENFVLNTFRSENYQYGTNLGYTTICGYVYNDLNADGTMNDGYGNGIANVKIRVTVMNNSSKALAKLTLKTDENGFYSFRLYDSVNGNKNITASENAISGLYLAEESLTINLEADIPLNLIALSKTASGTFYNNMKKNGFESGITNITISKENAHTTLISNCLMKEKN